MENVTPILELIAHIINIVGVVILTFGFTKELIKYLIVEFKDGILPTPLGAIQKIRCQLGTYVLLALDFLVASDVIMSVVELSMDKLIKLAAIIGLRIVLGYFVGKDIKELHARKDKRDL